MKFVDIILKNFKKLKIFVILYKIKILYNLYFVKINLVIIECVLNKNVVKNIVLKINIIFNLIVIIKISIFSIQFKNFVM